MSKRSTKAGSKAKRSTKRRWYLPVGALVLTASVALGITTQHWRILFPGSSRFSSRPVVQPPAPTIPDVNHPSKEYVYGGGKLIATESAKSDQTITFSSLADKTYGDAPFTVSASSSSGLGVTFAVVSGAATISGNTVTIPGAGTTTIRASQNGDGNYNAAADVDQSFTVAKASQTITFNSLADKTYGDAPFSLSASSSSGLGVTFAVLSGPATISGNTVTIPGAGAVTIRASQGGDGNHNAATDVDRSFNVAKAAASITLSSLTQTYDGTAKAATATTNPVGLSTVTITYNGATTAPSNAGSYAVVASLANNNYAAANPVGTLTIVGTSQTITFNPLSNKTYGDTPFAVNASASSGFPVSFAIISGPATVSANTVTITGAGSVTVRASQAGNANYNAAPDVDQSFTVAKTSQTITFNPLADKTYGDAPFGVSASASSGLAVTFAIVSGPATISGSTVTVSGAGTVTVRASQTGNGNYNVATGVDRSLTVAKASQTITFNTLTNKTYGDAPFALSASASSGLAVGFAIVSGTATISGSTMTVNGAGTVTVRASQTGDGNYNAATVVDRSFGVAKATPTIAWSNPADISPGTPLSATQLNAVAGFGGNSLSGMFVYSPAIGAVLETGNHQALSTTFSPTDTTNFAGASATVYINVTPTATTNGFSYRRSITIDHTKVPNTDQTNFPLFISGTYLYLKTTANGGNVENSNGYDVIFSSDTGCSNKLDHEVETYNASTGAVNYWIKVPTVSHTTDTVLYMCYGKASISSSQANPTGVWDSNYVAVYHLPNGSTLNANDSTSNPLSASISNASAGTGRVDGAGNFNGSTSRLGLPASTKWNNIAAAITLEAWINPSSGSLSDRRDVTQRQGGAWYGGLNPGSGSDIWWFNLLSGKPSFYADGITGGAYKQSTSAVSEGSWSHIAVTYNGSIISFYLNGALTNSISASGSFTTGDAGGSIGCNGSGFSPLTVFNGLIDELRVSSSARPADWINAEYNNQNSPSTFYAVSSNGTNGYAYRRTITIDHTKVSNTDQTNFPVAISGTFPYLATTANGGNVENSNGHDVIFASDTGCTGKLDHEVENYNATTGAASYWVKVPTLSHTTDTVLYMCYGNNGISTSQANPTAVWDSNFVAVYHLPNGSTLSANDSTASPLNASISNTLAGSGRVGGAGDFNGSSSRVGLPASTKWNNASTAITLETWVNPYAGSLSADRRDIIQRQGGAWYGGLNPGSGSDIWWFILITGKPSFYADNITGGSYKIATSPISEGSWSHVVVTYNGSTITFYVNGIVVNTFSATGNFSTGDAGGSIGCNGSGFSPLTPFSGLIDELRVSSSARSADWIKTEYNNQNSPSTFYTISTSAP